MVLIAMNESNMVNIPPAYVIDRMQIGMEGIVNQEYLNKWPHLSDMNIKFLESEVDLQNRNNVS